VYLDFSNAIERFGAATIKARYGNLFDMYERITGEDPYTVPMRIYPATHYTMGGLWVDYNLQTTVPGLFALGEANFSDHGANRLGASALMQGLADGYFVIPYTIGEYLADDIRTGTLSTDAPEFEAAEQEVRNRINAFLNNNGNRTVDSFHKELGKIMWDKCGMARSEQGLREAIAEIRALREAFYKEVRVPGRADTVNPELEKAGRVADFLELGELMCLDALTRNESCGGHFREEYQSEDGEALRDDENFAFVSAWEYTGDPGNSTLHKEELVFENVELKTRSYK
jgi:succinate dehydrogenase / fumarate reductase, flavoprotein subunit